MAVDTIEKALAARVSGFAGLGSLIGSGSSTRFFPAMLPQGTAKPAAYYEQYSVETNSSMSSDEGMEATFWHITIIADSFSSLKAVEAQMKKALVRWRQSIGFVVQDSFLEDVDNGYVDETKEHLSTLAIKIHHQTV